MGSKNSKSSAESESDNSNNNNNNNNNNKSGGTEKRTEKKIPFATKKRDNNKDEQHVKKEGYDGTKDKQVNQQEEVSYHVLLCLHFTFTFCLLFCCRMYPRC